MPVKYLKLSLICFLALAWLWFCPAAPAFAITLQSPVNFLSGTLNQGLAGYWTFDGKDVTDEIYDRSCGAGCTTGNNGYFYNGATSTAKVAGKVGQALKFDGVDDYIQASFSRITTGSISLWAYQNINKTYNTLISNAIGANAPNFYIANGKVSYAFSAASAVKAGTTIQTGKWYHLVVNIADETAEIYINGASETLSSQSSWAVGTVFCIAAQCASVPQSYSYFNGEIDDIRIYNRILSAGEIKQLYLQGGGMKLQTTVPVSRAGTLNSASSTSSGGLVGYWTFDGDKVTDKVYDSSGNGNNGYFYGGATSTAKVKGKLGQAISLNGQSVNSQYVRVGVTSSLAPTEALTVSAWIKANVTNGSYDMILGNTNSNGLSTGYGLYLNSSVLAFFINCYNGATCPSKGYLSTAFTDTNSWHHVAGTYNKEQILLYLDGIQKSSMSTTTSISYSGNVGFGIGTSAFASDIFKFNGLIDDVRVYNRGLSASEVKQLYLSGTGRLSVPGRPKNFRYTTRTRVSVSLSWQDKSNNESGFKVYKSSDGPAGPWTLAGTTAANAVSSSVTGLTRNTTYWFYIVAYNQYGASMKGTLYSNLDSSILSLITLN